MVLVDPCERVLQQHMGHDLQVENHLNSPRIFFLFFSEKSESSPAPDLRPPHLTRQHTRSRRECGDHILLLQNATREENKALPPEVVGESGLTRFLEALSSKETELQNEQDTDARLSCTSWARRLMSLRCSFLIG